MLAEQACKSITGCSSARWHVILSSICGAKKKQKYDIRYSSTTKQTHQNKNLQEWHLRLVCERISLGIPCSKFNNPLVQK